MNNDLTEDTAASIKDLVEKGGNPKEYCWPFNGLTPKGEAFGMDPASFLTWATAVHPEYVDEQTGMPLIYDFVFTKMDEDLLGYDGLAGTVMVTIRPDLGGGTSYALEARKAADRYPANPQIRARFDLLAEAFFQKGM